MNEKQEEILQFLRDAGRATFKEIHEGTERGSKTALMKLLMELREDGEIFEPTAIHFAAVEGGE